ncbi:lipopolysaccharide transport system permease protein/teichoic acid transport system permease protein [Evansella caseinilytica]|uniref:Transport permease protein n=1 Tax=Evansella caseinilytica TaxID=1503961 RepID=A0A1H3TZH9_9BACI|nr:ABC transporter permease [Evansella caseinilytica]SDZ55613.1 lipopolysaccharide transport system permease protein/teichoic acid transport system permease protein [Evansella caseinilytica]
MREYIKEMLKRKDLLIYLVKSGLKAEHRNSYLGYFWWLLDPLLNMVVYYFLVVVILGRYSEEPTYPVYLAIGLIAWRWMNTTVNTSSRAIVKYSSIINQVYLPKSLFPLATAATQMFNFAFGLIVIAIFLVAFGVIPGWQVIFLPVIIFIQMLFLIAVSLFVSYICVFVRDIDNILTHILRMFFYASPIIWIGSRLPERFDWVVAMNPVAVLLDSYRAVLMYQSYPNFFSLFVIGLISVCIITLMLYHYSRNEHKIIKAL